MSFSIIKHKTLIFFPLFCSDLILQMLSKIEKPPIVICVLCRGSVSIRKGDRTRFFNHIINDHEVHYDMELFFALCYLDKEEKETFVNVVKTKNNNGSVSTESLLVEESNGLAEETSDSNDKHEKDKKDNSVMTEHSCEKEVNESHGETTNNDSNDKKTSPLEPSDITSKESISSIKKERIKCPQCKIMVPKKDIIIHMKLKHKRKLKSIKQAITVTSCQFCEKTMKKVSISRHMRKVHGVTKKLYQESQAVSVNETKELATSTKIIKDEPVEHNVEKYAEETVDPLAILESNNISNFLNQENGRGKSLDLECNADGYKKCKICSKTIKKTYYSSHLREVHSAGKKHFCSLCYLGFKRRDNMIHHVDNVHKSDLEWVDEKKQAKFSPEDCKVACKNCGKNFISVDSMNHHNDRKHGNGNFQCSICERKFSALHHLKKHNKTICT